VCSARRVVPLEVVLARCLDGDRLVLVPRANGKYWRSGGPVDVG
jgi:hypothetical protein